MIKYMILIVILVKIDVLIISYGLIINVHVSHNIVGGIKIVKMSRQFINDWWSINLCMF